MKVRVQSATGQQLNAEGAVALQQILNVGQHPDMRWADFGPYQGEAKEFYRKRPSLTLYPRCE